MTGTAEDGQVQMTLDASRRVTQVTVVSLTDTTRRPDGLAMALRRAHLDATSELLDAERLAAGGSLEREPRRPVAAAEPGTRPVTTHFGHASREDVEHFRATYRRSVGGPARSVTGVSGVSGNACVRVSLDPASSYGTVDVDPGWLATARVSQVGAAIGEAFQDAYDERDRT